MRVIAGRARGKRLISPKGEETRPTPDRVKEALFNILQFSVEGRRFLDLFAGTGQIGIEAVSRGAQEAVLVELSAKSAAIVSQNVKLAGFEQECRVIVTDSLLYLKRSPQPFDTAFLDPPYRTGLLQKALPLTAAVMNPGGIILCEHPADEVLPEQAGEFFKEREYRYGKILLTSYRRPL